MARFRFQDLKIWEEAIDIGDSLFDIADIIEEKKLYRFSEQIRGSGMSMSNNIAEGAGSDSKAEFKNFLNIAKRSTFENANILIILNKRNLIHASTLDLLLGRLEILCRKITAFRKLLMTPCTMLHADKGLSMRFSFPFLSIAYIADDFPLGRFSRGFRFGAF